MRSNQRRGSAFIEVLVALVLFATAAIGLVTMLGQTEHSLRQVSNSEAETHSAAGELARLSLLSRAQLLAELGSTSTTQWNIEIEQRSPALFDVAVLPLAGAEPLVRTSFYRPDLADAVR